MGAKRESKNEAKSALEIFGPTLGAQGAEKGGSKMVPKNDLKKELKKERYMIGSAAAAGPVRAFEIWFQKLKIWFDTPFDPQRGAADCKG